MRVLPGMSDPDSDTWKAQAQAGWAALHNIREVLTVLAPPGSLPDPNVIIPPDYAAEAGQLIAAIHALHERAVGAEEALAEARERAGCALTFDAGKRSGLRPCSGRPRATAAPLSVACAFGPECAYYQE